MYRARDDNNTHAVPQARDRAGARHLRCCRRFAAARLLRTEPIAAGSVFFVKNTATQPLTAYLIELVNYPGSSYTLWQDELVIAARSHRRRRGSLMTSTMTIGAVPDYVKLQATPSSPMDPLPASLPKITQLVERRRFLLATTRELIARLGKSGASKPT